ncbi:MAG TPA: carboxypeptidase regulatory-like domain-containing protein [Patescibacteria group bacterium]|nr:carboxypeptidase regulatory-like domain-containing protein [Patescibacteria group bacterium]
MITRKFILAVILIGLLFAGVNVRIRAQEVRNVNVTATVVDTIPPSVPVLISPPNGSTVSTFRPTFVWQESTDAQGIAKYQLYIDGFLYQDNLQVTTFTPPADLSPGTHTWKIVAFDTSGNQSESETWVFTIEVAGVALVTETITQIQETIAQTFAQAPILKTFLQFLPLIALITPAIVTTIAALTSSAPLLSWLLEIIGRLLQTLGLIPKRKARGIVYDTKTGNPVAFATVNIINLKTNVTEVVVSDQRGVYYSVRLPDGQYRIDVAHSEYIFPTKLPRPRLSAIEDFYKGETFEVTESNREVFFIIPLDPKKVEEKQKGSRSIIFTRLLRRINRATNALFIPMAILSLVVTFLFPTILNAIISLLYVSQIILRAVLARTRPVLTMIAKDRQGNPMPNVIMRVAQTKDNSLRAIVITGPTGTATLNISFGDYSLTVNKEGFIAVNPDQTTDIVYYAHRTRKDELMITMVSTQEFLGN